MEAADSGARQSTHASASIAGHQQQLRQLRHAQPLLQGPSRQREPQQRQYQDQLAMATASILAPSAHHQPQTSYSSGYSHPGSGARTGNMISSGESRWHPDEDGLTRQSLPSISEVISGTKRDPYPHTASPSIQPGSNLAKPISTVARAYVEPERRHSPQPLSAPSYSSRPEPLPSFTSSPRPPAFNGVPSLSAVPGRRSSPGGNPEPSPRHVASEMQKSHDSHVPDGPYMHPQHQHPPPTTLEAPMQHAQLSPAQMPFPNYTAQPPPHYSAHTRHSAGPHRTSQYDPIGPPPAPATEADNKLRTILGTATLNRHFENWSYQEALSRVASSSRTIYNFAEAYMKIASEQNQPQPIPEKLPTEREVGEMLSNIELMKRSLEQVRETIQVSIQNEQAREGAKAKAPGEEDQDLPMYGDGLKAQYPMNEVKKRRGRAAPPGRCHSCNRMDTPEWRRGPDGARTLCNACGLHYAKLERKRQLEARQIRPKHKG